MAPTFAPGYIAPGFYVKQQDVSTPDVPQGARIPAFVGQGSKTLQRQQTLVKGAVNGQDGPLTGDKAIDILSVVDSNNVTYTKGTDYKATRVGDALVVDWSPQASITGSVDLSTLTYPGDLEGKTLRLVVNGGTPNPVDQAVTFTNAQNANDVATQINAWLSMPTFASLTAGNLLVLTANSVLVEEGDANSKVGFSTGDDASVLEPEVGSSYSVTYTSDKSAAEYAPKLFSNMNDVIAYYGDKRGAFILYSGTATAAGAATLTDADLALTVDSLVGKYIKIASGPGKGQVRVIISNTATTVTVSQGWTSTNLPTAASDYTITDINENSITLGAQVSFDTGGTFAIGSQYADDLFNDANIRGAIDNLKQSVQGQDPDCIVLMKGLGASEVAPVTFLKNHCVEMSNEINNKFRVGFIGLAQGNENYLTFVNLANGTKNRRITTTNITSVNRDFGDGVSLSLDGSYVAAALAGVYCSFVDAGEPITRKSIANAFNVDTFVDPFLVKEKDLMAAAGVTIIERQGTDLRIRHALTTDNTSAFTQELKATRMADFISKYLRTNLDNVLTGQRFVISTGGKSDVVSTAKTMFRVLLEALKNPQAQIITDIQDLDVQQDQTEPRQLDFKANLTLTGDVLWSYALLGMKL